MKKLNQKELLEINGGCIFKEGSFLDAVATATSSGYRGFKAYLREIGVCPQR